MSQVHHRRHHHHPHLLCQHHHPHCDHLYDYDDESCDGDSQASHPFWGGGAEQGGKTSLSHQVCQIIVVILILIIIIVIIIIIIIAVIIFSISLLCF